MSDKAINNAKENLKNCILEIKTDIPEKGINRFNSKVMGIQNYYCIANDIFNNLTKINYAILPSIDSNEALWKENRISTYEKRV